MAMGNNPINIFDPNGMWDFLFGQKVFNLVKGNGFKTDNQIKLNEVPDAMTINGNIVNIDLPEFVITANSPNINSYGGIPVHKFPLDVDFNIPVIGIFVNNRKDLSWIQHEHGHYLIFQQKGLEPWWDNAKQSMKSYIFNSTEEHFYSEPEIEANMLEYEFQGRPPVKIHPYPIFKHRSIPLLQSK